MKQKIIDIREALPPEKRSAARNSRDFSCLEKMLNGEKIADISEAASQTRCLHA